MTISSLRLLLGRNMPFIATAGVLIAAITFGWQFITPQKPPTQAETKKETPETNTEQRKTLHRQPPPLTFRSKVIIGEVITPKTTPDHPSAQKIEQHTTVNAPNSNVVVGPINGNVTQNYTNEFPKDRHLTHEQKLLLESKFYDLVHNFKLTQIHVASVYDDEAIAYSEEISNCFKPSGVRIYGENQISSTQRYGVIINAAFPAYIASHIANIFKLAKIDYKIEKVGDEHLAVLVGLQPKK